VLGARDVILATTRASASPVRAGAFASVGLALTSGFLRGGLWKVVHASIIRFAVLLFQIGQVTSLVVYVLEVYASVWTFACKVPGRLTMTVLLPWS
jgi:hypothetical protein